MAKVCEICGKSTVAGRRIQHHHSIGWRFRAQRKTRQFKPNLRSIKVEVNGKETDIVSCMKCYKKLRKDQPEVFESQIASAESAK